jgi:hypothetical protein
MQTMRKRIARLLRRGAYWLDPSPRATQTVSLPVWDVNGCYMGVLSAKNGSYSAQLAWRGRES